MSNKKHSHFEYKWLYVEIVFNNFKKYFINLIYTFVGI